VHEVQVIAPYVNVHFFGSSLTFMMVYLWGRRNPAERLSFLWIFSFTAPYLPWVLLGFSMLLGHPVDVDAIGIIAGHLYFFLKDVYPAVAKSRGWKIYDIFPTPSILYVFDCWSSKL
jgi:Derlin-2/3